MTNVGLKSVEGFKLPKLRSCNIADNAIADIKSIAALVATSPMLESISVHGNPCASKPRVRERLAASSVHRLLRSIDGREASINEIIAGIEEFGDKRQRAGFVFEKLFKLFFLKKNTTTISKNWIR